MENWDWFKVICIAVVAACASDTWWETGLIALALAFIIPTEKELGK